VSFTTREIETARAWLKDEPAGAKSAPAGAYGYSIGGGPVYSDAYRFRRAPSSGELVEQFKSIIYFCCWMNANAVSRIPLRLYAVTKRGQSRPKSFNYPAPVKRGTAARLKALPYLTKTVAGIDEIDEVTHHPLLDAVQWVSDDLDHNQLLQYTTIALDLFGHAYWWPFLDRWRVPQEIWPLPSQFVWPVMQTASMVPTAYQFGSAIYQKDELVRFRRVAPKNPYGLGLGSAQASIEYARLEDVFVSLQDNMLSNGPRPSVLISHKDPKGAFGPAERKRLEDDMEKRGRGGRAGGVFVVDGAVEMKNLSYQPADVGIVEISDYNLERICNAFDVPTTFFSKDTNLANSQAATEHHARNAVEPRCKAIAATLTRWTHSLDSRGDRNYDRLFWAFDRAVIEDKQSEAELHKTYFAMGLPLNRILLEIDQDPVEGGDVSLVPSNLTPLATLVAGQSVSAREASPLDTSRLDQDADDDDFTAEAEETDADAEAERTTDDEDLPRSAKYVPTERSFDGMSENLAWDSLSSARLKGKRSRRGRSRGGSGGSGHSGRGNPCHDERGRFSSGCGSSASGKLPKIPKKPKHPKEPTTPKPGAVETTETHGETPHPSGTIGSSEGFRRQAVPWRPAEERAKDPKRKPTPRAGPHPKEGKAKSEEKVVGKEEHEVATEKEKEVGTFINGEWLQDHEPVDVVRRKPSNPDLIDGIDVKVLLFGDESRVRMAADTGLRKVEALKKEPEGSDLHLVVIDYRGVYKGGLTKRGQYETVYYYKRNWFSNCALSRMYKCESIEEVRRLMELPDDELPELAKGVQGKYPTGEAFEKLKERAKTAAERRKQRDERRRERQRLAGLAEDGGTNGT
jgi:hypothetical protein